MSVPKVLNISAKSMIYSNAKNGGNRSLTKSLKRLKKSKIGLAPKTKYVLSTMISIDY